MHIHLYKPLKTVAYTAVTANFSYSNITRSFFSTNEHSACS